MSSIAPETDVRTDLAVKAEITLRYDLYVPPGVDKPSPLLIAVHGYGAHKRQMMREARLVAPSDFVIASPQAPYQHFRKTDDALKTGFGWLTDHRPEESVQLHHKFIRDLIDQLANDRVADPERIVLYGFSQACALNFRFAFTYPDVLKGIIGVCGGIPGDLETNPAYKPFDAETFYLYGDEDEFYPFEKFQGFEQQLYDLLPNFHSKYYSAGHEITDEMRADIRGFLGSI